MKSNYDHAARLKAIGQNIVNISDGISERNLHRLMQHSQELQKLVRCLFAKNYYQPPLEVESENFSKDAAKYLKESEGRGLRVLRDGKPGIFVCNGSWLHDPSSYCPLCD